MAEGESGEGPHEVLLKDLRPGDETSILLARVLNPERREVTLRGDGSRRPVLSGYLSDGSATLRFTWWDPPKEGIEAGVVLRAARFTVREYRGRPEIAFNGRTRVQEASELELPQGANDLRAITPIAALTGSEADLCLEVRVIRVAPKTVPVSDGVRQLFEGVVADRSGLVGFTAWTDLSLRTDEVVRVSGATARSFRGHPQLTLDGRSVVVRLDRRHLPPASELAAWRRCTLAELALPGYRQHVELSGRVVALAPPSGIVHRCPQCRRRLTEGACRQHGAVTGIPELRARIVLDDGTGTVVVTSGPETTERLTGLSLERSLGISRGSEGPSALEDALFHPLFGLLLTARGDVSIDSFGATLEPQEIVESHEGGTQDVNRLSERFSRMA